MLKHSFLFLIILVCVALISAYHALFPIQAVTILTRLTALIGFMLLCLALSMGPLAVLRPKTFAPVLEARRAVGIGAFAFGAVHGLIAFALLYNSNLGYFLGQVAFLLVLPATILMAILTVTSTDWAMRNVPSWKNIQRLAYPIFVLVLGHFILHANGVPGITSGPFVNLAELAAMLFAFATITLQIAGFYTVRKRKAASGTNQSQETPAKPPPTPAKLDQVPQAPQKPQMQTTKPSTPEPEVGLPEASEKPPSTQTAEAQQTNG